MYDNVFLPVQNLRKPARIKPGGLCKFFVAKYEDVQVWPSPNPDSGGVLDQSIQMKVGTTLYIVEATNKERSFKEKPVFGPEGTAVEITVTGSLAGNTVNNVLGIAAMMFHKYVIITEGNDGIYRLVGNQDGGASMNWDYDEGDQTASRYRNLKWTWLHNLSAPIYNGGPVITDITQIYTQITLLDRFRVGAVDAPMDDLDTIYENDLLIGRNFIMLADGIAIHQLPDNPGQRYCSKPFNSNTITVNGGVSQDEVIEIYLIS